MPSTSTLVTGGYNSGGTSPSGTAQALSGSPYKLSSVISPEGNRTDYTYGERWNVIKIERKAKSGSGQASLVRTASYRACTGVTDLKVCNQPTSSVDESGDTTRYTYDPDAGLVSAKTLPAVQSPAGTVEPQTRYSYTPLYATYRQASNAAESQAPYPIYKLTRESRCLTQTLASCVGTADEIVKTYTYNPNLQLSSVTTSAGDNSVNATISYEYDEVGNLIRQEGPLASQVVRHFYDAARQRYATIDADPDENGQSASRVSWITYDLDGLATSTRLGYSASGSFHDFVVMQETKQSFDGARRKISEEVYVENILTSRKNFSYDALNRLECTAVRMNLTAAVPASACDLGAEGGFGPDRITKNTYDAAGQLKVVKQAVGTTVERTERLQTFTANGKTQSIVDANGNRTGYTYDGLDRLARTIFPHPNSAGVSNSADYEEIQTYSAASQPITKRLRDGNIVSYSYDALDRNTGIQFSPVAFGEAANTSFVYDNVGRLRSATDSNGLNVYRSYNALGCMSGEQDLFGLKAIECDDSNRIIALTFSDGFRVRYSHRSDGMLKEVLEDSGFTISTFGYDEFSRLRTRTAGNGVLSSYGFTPGVAGISTIGHAIAGASVNIALAYNPGGQIVQLGKDNELFGWPHYSPRNTAYGVNGLNQVTAIAGFPTAHDARGNLTQANGDSWSFGLFNRLATAANGQASSTVLYDATGRIAQVQKNGTTRDLNTSVIF
jgi:YD repeat-containing protein